jgi:hypothetical protein
MAQVKIYGTAERLPGRRAAMSDVIHAALMEAFVLPADKRFQRFFPLAAEDFIYPAGRSADYTIIEITLFEGRTVAAKKTLYRELFRGFEAELGIRADDLEITLIETPRHDWGIRGAAGDELGLTYEVDV